MNVKTSGLWVADLEKALNEIKAIALGLDVAISHSELSGSVRESIVSTLRDIQDIASEAITPSEDAS